MDYSSNELIRIPNRREVWTSPSYRRFLLDTLLKHYSNFIKGDVVDLGGKRAKRRGSFVAPTDGVSSWKVVNISADASPDILADITDLPLANDCADVVLLCETLEHIDTPYKALTEAFRILKPGGMLIGSCPFLFPVHGDPFDFNRWTADGLSFALRKTAFDKIKLHGMGASLGSIAMLVELSTEHWIVASASSGNVSLIRRLVLRLNRLLTRFAAYVELLLLAEGVFDPGNKFTTGYLFIASKPAVPGQST